MFFATAAPPCIATCATPGSGLPSARSCVMEARSPITKISGWPGTDRSGSTMTRPMRSSGAPIVLPSGEAATPAAHTTS
jgi:hypothetical protein